MSYMEIRNLKKVYNPYGMHPKVALNGLDFKVEKGDFICIMGASGSGKTTLVNILSTIDEATGGQILLNQKDLLLLSEKEKAKLRKEEIGFIFQNYNLIESLTIKNNILFSPRLNKVNQQTQLERLHELTKIYTTSSFKADEATTGYILNSSTLKDITFSAPKIPSLATMQLFIDCIEADYELDDVPDIFTDNIKSEELGLLWNLNKNNYNYSFQKAYCYDSTWDEFGNPTTLYWILSFQKNNFTNDNSNPKELILYITVEYTDSNQFKISSILKK